MAAIVCNQCDKAVQIFSANEEYEDGKVVKALQLTSVFKNVLDVIQSKKGSGSDKNSGNFDVDNGKI